MFDVPPAHGISAPELAIVHQINRLRLRMGIRRVHITRKLTRKARRHTLDMLAHGTLTHQASNGVSFVERMSDTPYWLVGETLAFVPSSLRADAPSVVYAWLMSPMHREQLLEPSYWRVGVSRMAGAIGSESGVAITVNFSTRR